MVERQVADLDGKIKLLIKNRIDVEEATQALNEQLKVRTEQEGRQWTKERLILD